MFVLSELAFFVECEGEVSDLIEDSFSWNDEFVRSGWILLFSECW